MVQYPLSPRPLSPSYRSGTTQSSVTFFGHEMASSMVFDSTVWYGISIPSGFLASSTTLYLSNNTKGAVFINSFKDSSADRNWQLLDMGSGSYVLRTQQLGANATLQPQYIAGEGTTPTIASWTLSSGCLWYIKPWGDGTFYFTNQANGTSMNLDTNSSPAELGHLEMNSDTHSSNVNQHWNISSVGTITQTQFTSVRNGEK